MVKHLLGHKLRTNWQRWNSQGVRTSAYWFRNSECNLAAEVHVFGSRTLKVVILLSGPCGKCRPRGPIHFSKSQHTLFGQLFFVNSFVCYLFQSRHLVLKGDSKPTSPVLKKADPRPRCSTLVKPGHQLVLASPRIPISMFCEKLGRSDTFESLFGD